jgi:hypothetical protein
LTTTWEASHSRLLRSDPVSIVVAPKNTLLENDLVFHNNGRLLSDLLPDKMKSYRDFWLILYIILVLLAHGVVVVACRRLVGRPVDASVGVRPSDLHQCD